MNRRLSCAVAIFAALTAITSHAEAPFDFQTTPGKLPKVVIPLSYDIQLKPNIDELTFSGSETVILDVRKPVKTITLNVNTVTIVSAKLLKADDKTNQYARITIDPKKETATLAFDIEIPAGRHQISVDFTGKINEAPKGLYYARYREQGSSAKKIMLGTNMEPSDARRMFPCWDEPSFRAKFRLSAMLPVNFTAVSNMPVEIE